ncbi:hypothetical protein LJC15_02380 [Desulfovibrio sp. OttesenSCG-928-G11]|nr:hypothetical protein [Desulfovibrio sp. OttesenSCG-928-G11]
MGKRHESIGIKQVVRLEWYNLALDLLLRGRPKNEIRQELTKILKDRLQSGGFGERGESTYVKAVGQIMQCWVTPAKELIPFRDKALQCAQECPRNARLPIHWAVTIAAYPFWHKVAVQVGRLLNLQPVVSQAQIRKRCYEAFGERSTIERSARRVIRSFVTWEVLKDSLTKGCYEKHDPIPISNQTISALLIEATLYTSPTGSMPLSIIKDDPALFPFHLPPFNGNMLTLPGVEYIRHGLDNELLKLCPTAIGRHGKG